MWQHSQAQPQPSDFEQRLRKGERLEELQKEVNFRAALNALDRDTATTKDLANLVNLRIVWGKLILGLLVATMGFNIVLVALVGVGVWKFTNNATFLNVVAGQNLAQVVGLVAIVLKSLFK